MRVASAVICVGLTAAAATTSCGSDVSSTMSAVCATNPANYDPSIAPADFSTTIDNRWLAYAPGTVFKFVRTDGNFVEQDVTTDTRVIMGVTTLAVHDFQTTPGGMLAEDTFDYFAQDKGGNVWYFGEDTKAYSGSTVSTAGTWYAGVNCAKPGIVMKADPQIGDDYRQEYLPGEAEDQATVVSLSETVTVPYGTFSNCVMTKEYTVLAPGDIENKYYCAQVGLIRSHDVGTIDAGSLEDLASVNGKTMP